MDILEKAAEILVECGYENCSLVCKNGARPPSPAVGFNCGSGVITVDPFSDTLEGRRQADAIEDWLRLEYGELFEKSTGINNAGAAYYIIAKIGGSHQCRLDRIKWCLEQLTQPSCFGKKLGVEACFNDICRHSDECYRDEGI